MIEIAGTLLITEGGNVVLQRRDDLAPSSPGKLALFGGGVEKKDASKQAAAARELAEETSLDVGKLVLEYVTEFPAGEKYFFIFRAMIPDVEFEVYEGVGSETYPMEEVLQRNDLTESARRTIQEVLGGQ